MSPGSLSSTSPSPGSTPPGAAAVGLTTALLGIGNNRNGWSPVAAVIGAAFVIGLQLAAIRIERHAVITLSGPAPS
jgi:hypothetical protein